jgi:hypothetical protein
MKTDLGTFCKGNSRVLGTHKLCVPDKCLGSLEAGPS